jgi:acetyl-CoA carboxylase beta subunit
MVIERRARHRADQWFHENEKRFIEENRNRRDERIRQELAREEARKREELRLLHWMRCPKCGQLMAEQELEGVKIDVCGLCEGIYFDRGELEALVEKRAEARRGFFRHLVGLQG